VRSAARVARAASRATPSATALMRRFPTLRAMCRRVVYEKDKKVENAGKFIIEREDHTLGNLVRMQLLEDHRVDFAGYRMQHPLEHKIFVQVHTTAETNPADAMITACNSLIDKLNRMEEKFDAEVRRKQHEASLF
jgi:DNA-directed RNA polymerase II subunit RPB11